MKKLILLVAILFGSQAVAMDYNVTQIDDDNYSEAVNTIVAAIESKNLELIDPETYNLDEADLDAICDTIKQILIEKHHKELQEKLNLMAESKKFGRIFLQHNTEIVSIKFNKKLILTASSDGIVKLWNYFGKLLQEIDAKHKRLISASFSPDGNLILTTGASGIVKLWDLNGQLIAILNHKKLVQKEHAPNNCYYVSSHPYDRDCNAQYLYVPTIKDQVNTQKESYFFRDNITNEILIRTTSTVKNPRCDAIEVNYVWDLDGQQIDFDGEESNDNQVNNPVSIDGYEFDRYLEIIYNKPCNFALTRDDSNSATLFSLQIGSNIKDLQNLSLGQLVFLWLCFPQGPRSCCCTVS